MRTMIGKLIRWFIAAVPQETYDPRYFDDEAAKHK